MAGERQTPASARRPVSRRAFVGGACLLLLVPAETLAGAPPPAPASAPDGGPWWMHELFSFAQGTEPNAMAATRARVVIVGCGSDPTWGPYAQRLTELDAGTSCARIAQGGQRRIAWIEGFGDCMVYAAAFVRAEDGSFLGREEDPRVPRTVRNHWNWADPRVPAGNALRWVGIHNSVNAEDFVPPGMTLRAIGVPPPRYPDGRVAIGVAEGGRYPLDARVYDACGAKDLNGRIAAAFELPVHVNDPAAGGGAPAGPIEGLYPAIVGLDDVAAPPGVGPGQTVYAGVISVHKDLSAPFWRDYSRASVRAMARLGLDGAWCDNYSPWDNFGYPPIRRAFGEWSVALFHTHVRGAGRRALAEAGVDDPAAFDVRRHLRARAVELGARAEAPLDHGVWSDSRWNDDPIWRAFKAFRQRQAHRDMRAFDRALHAAARQGGRPDFCVGGNDIPFYGLGWTRDAWLDMVNTEVTPGWHMGTGTRGLGLPPSGKMAVAYRAARDHQRAPFAGAWYYLDGDAAPYQDNPGLARVLMAEAFAHGAFLLCDPSNPRVAGDTASHAWWTQFIAQNESALRNREPVDDAAVLFSPDNQLDLLAPGGFPDFDRQPHMFGHWGWATALLDAHVPYRAIADWHLGQAGLRGLRALVLPDTACLSDAALRALERWLRAGGSAVVTGPCGTRHGPEDDFRPRDAARLAALAPSLAGEGPAAARVRRVVESIGMDYHLRHDARASLLPRLAGLLGPSTVADGSGLPATVGLSVWRARDDAALYADLHNYDIDLAADRVRPAEGLALRLWLPDGWGAVEAVTLSPDDDAPARVNVEGGQAAIRLDRLTHYATVRLERWR